MSSGKALIGLHDAQSSDDLASRFVKKGYEVEKVYCLEGMLTKMGLSLDSPVNMKPTISYDFYVMDTNLGIPNGFTCESASRIYGHIKEEVLEGKIRFLSITANAQAEKEARKQEIPVLERMKGMMELMKIIR